MKDFQLLENGAELCSCFWTETQRDTNLRQAATRGEAFENCNGATKVK